MCYGNLSEVAPGCDQDGIFCLQGLLSAVRGTDRWYRLCGYRLPAEELSGVTDTYYRVEVGGYTVDRHPPDQEQELPGCAEKL